VVAQVEAEQLRPSLALLDPVALCHRGEKESFHVGRKKPRIPLSHETPGGARREQQSYYRYCNKCCLAFARGFASDFPVVPLF